MSVGNQVDNRRTVLTKDQRERERRDHIRTVGRNAKDPLPYDPQGYQLDIIARLACQAAVIFSLFWGLGAVKGLFLPPMVGVLPLMLVCGALLIAPRTVIMQIPISLSILGIIAMHLASILWTIDPFATSIIIRGLLPSMISLVLAAAMLRFDDFAQAAVWALRLTLFVTVVALIVDPSTRTHVSTDQYLPDYPGWHGYFIHKNEMTPVLVFGVATTLTLDRHVVTRWATLAVIGILLIGSTSATGITGAFFVGVVWYWLRIYRGQQDERNSTLFMSVTVLGFLGVLAGILASLATITSAYGKDTTFSGRTDIWEAGWHFFWQRPFLGYGTGALFWREPINLETAEITRRVGFPAAHAHNGLLDLVLQVGLIGLFLFGVLWVTTLRRAWSSLQLQPELAIWILSFIASNLLMAFSEHVYSYTWIGVFAGMKTLLMRRPEALGRPKRRLFNDAPDY